MKLSYDLVLVKSRYYGNPHSRLHGLADEERVVLHRSDFTHVEVGSIIKTAV